MSDINKQKDNTCVAAASITAYTDSQIKAQGQQEDSTKQTWCDNKSILQQNEQNQASSSIVPKISDTKRNQSSSDKQPRPRTISDGINQQTFQNQNSKQEGVHNNKIVKNTTTPGKNLEKQQQNQLNNNCNNAAAPPDIHTQLKQSDQQSQQTINLGGLSDRFLVNELKKSTQQQQNSSAVSAKGNKQATNNLHQSQSLSDQQQQQQQALKTAFQLNKQTSQPIEEDISNEKYQQLLQQQANLARNQSEELTQASAAALIQQQQNFMKHQKIPLKASQMNSSQQQQLQTINQSGQNNHRNNSLDQQDTTITSSSTLMKQQQSFNNQVMMNSNEQQKINQQESSSQQVYDMPIEQMAAESKQRTSKSSTRANKSSSSHQPNHDQQPSCFQNGSSKNPLTTERNKIQKAVSIKEINNQSTTQPSQINKAAATTTISQPNNNPENYLKVMVGQQNKQSRQPAINQKNKNVGIYQQHQKNLLAQIEGANNNKDDPQSSHHTSLSINLKNLNNQQKSSGSQGPPTGGNKDLSNRSGMILTPGTQQTMLNAPLYLNQCYSQNTQGGNPATSATTQGSAATVNRGGMTTAPLTAHPGMHHMLNNHPSILMQQQPSPVLQHGAPQRTGSGQLRQDSQGRRSNNHSNQNSCQFQQQQQQPQSPAISDPYFYLQWRQQKYKSCRSTLYSNDPQTQKNYHHAAATSTQNNNSYMFPNTANLIHAIQGGTQMTLTPHQPPQHNSRGNSRKRHANQTLRNTNKKHCGGVSSCSSAGSQTTSIPVRALKEVKNPQALISFRFVNLKVTHLNEIGLFKNLTELDVSGNLLKEEIKELKSLTFLKKLNLSDNQIEHLWPLPSNLEILNISYNCMKQFNPNVSRQLKNLTTLDITNNGLESLDGLEQLTRLKRLIAKTNQVSDLKPLVNIDSLIEIDLENNPVDSYVHVLNVIQNKKDLLIFNLKLAPLLVKINSYDQFVKELAASAEGIKAIGNGNHVQEGKDSPTPVQLSGSNREPLCSADPRIVKFKKYLKFFQNGILFRSKRVFGKIRCMQQTNCGKQRSISNFSNNSSSQDNKQQSTNNNGNNQNFFQPLLMSGNNNNSGAQQIATPAQSRMTQRYEDIELLYDEIIDEEEQFMLRLIRKEKKLMKKLNGGGDEDAGGSSDDDIEDGDDDDDALLYDEDDFNNGTYSGEEEDLDDLQSYKNQFGGPEEQEHEFLNESTADFNKEIRQINQELFNDGQLENVQGDIKQTPNTNNNKQKSTRTGNNGDPTQPSFRVDTRNYSDDSQVKNSQNPSQAMHNKADHLQNQQHASMTTKKNPISFKLDLSKCQNDFQLMKEDEENQEFEFDHDLQSFQGQLAMAPQVSQSFRVDQQMVVSSSQPDSAVAFMSQQSQSQLNPNQQESATKLNTNRDKINIIENDDQQSQNSSRNSQYQERIELQSSTSTNQKSSVHIPKLALQNLKMEVVEQQQSIQEQIVDPEQIKISFGTPSSRVLQSSSKAAKVMSSKRDHNSPTVIKKNQINRAPQGTDANRQQVTITQTTVQPQATAYTGSAAAEPQQPEIIKQSTQNTQVPCLPLNQITTVDQMEGGNAATASSANKQNLVKSSRRKTILYKGIEKTQQMQMESYRDSPERLLKQYQNIVHRIKEVIGEPQLPDSSLVDRITQLIKGDVYRIKHDEKVKEIDTMMLKHQQQINQSLMEQEDLRAKLLRIQDKVQVSITDAKSVTPKLRNINNNRNSGATKSISNITTSKALPQLGAGGLTLRIKDIPRNNPALLTDDSMGHISVELNNSKITHAKTGRIVYNTSKIMNKQTGIIPTVNTAANQSIQKSNRSKPVIASGEIHVLQQKVSESNYMTEKTAYKSNIETQNNDIEQQDRSKKQLAYTPSGEVKEIAINNSSQTTKRKLTASFKRLKRPQSVTASNSGKSRKLLNQSLMMFDQQADETSLIGDQDRNNKNRSASILEEYGSNKTNKQSKSSCLKATNTFTDAQMANQSKQVTKKVGIYLERLRERNSSLQERLNQSFTNRKYSNGNMAKQNSHRQQLNLTVIHHSSTNNKDDENNGENSQQHQTKSCNVMPSARGNQKGTNQSATKASSVGGVVNSKALPSSAVNSYANQQIQNNLTEAGLKSPLNNNYIDYLYQSNTSSRNMKNTTGKIQQQNSNLHNFYQQMQPKTSSRGSLQQQQQPSTPHAIANTPSNQSSQFIQLHKLPNKNTTFAEEHSIAQDASFLNSQKTQRLLQAQSFTNQQTQNPSSAKQQVTQSSVIDSSNTNNLVNIAQLSKVTILNANTGGQTSKYHSSSQNKGPKSCQTLQPIHYNGQTSRQDGGSTLMQSSSKQQLAEYSNYQQLKTERHPTAQTFLGQKQVNNFIIPGKIKGTTSSTSKRQLQQPKQ